MDPNVWACDAPVSMPEPLEHENPGLRQIGGGFTFTEWGMRFDLSEADHEAIRTPTFAPAEMPTEYADGR